jgi:ubiquitin-protein ligase
MDQIDPMSTCTYTGQNCIVPCFNQNRELVEFIIDSSLYCWSSPRYMDVFNPLPPNWVAMGLTLDKIKQVTNINTDFDFIISCIQSSISDDVLIQKIGHETYGFIKHAISSNKCIDIEPYELLILQNPDAADAAGGTGAAAATGISKFKLKRLNKQIYQFKLNYSKDIDQQFSENVIQLYHGTSFECVRPILCSGIRNCSGTKLQTTGAVYGNGIYLSDDLNISLGYSRGEKRRVFFIYDVINNPKWQKTTGIYVVDDEKALLLRFIIVLNDSIYITPEIIESLNRKLKSGSIKAYEVRKAREIQSVMSKTYSKRLMAEYKRAITSNPVETGFSVELVDPDSLYVWKLKIHRIDNEKLQGQMTHYNIPFIEIEITFPPEYPIKPPFVRIVHPHFRTMTGHITAGGSLCMEALSNSGWVPSTSVEALIIQVRSVLSDGGAEIDPSNFNKKYTMEEAREAFARAMKVHNW